MLTVIRRIAVLLATSSGILATTALTAHAGLNFANHCEPRSPANPPTIASSGRGISHRGNWV